MYYGVHIRCIFMKTIKKYDKWKERIILWESIRRKSGKSEKRVQDKNISLTSQHIRENVKQVSKKGRVGCISDKDMAS